MKGDLKSIDVGGDDVEEIGVDEDEDSDDQGTQQDKGSNKNASGK